MKQQTVKMEKDMQIVPKLMDVKILMQYLSLGRDGAREFGTEAGAVIRYGNRVLYDRDLIDKYIEVLRNEENQKN